MIAKILSRLDSSFRIFILASADLFFLGFAVLLTLLFNKPFQGISYSWIYIFILILGIPFYFITGQYKPLTRYTGSKSLYSLLLRNISLVVIIFLAGEVLGLETLPLQNWILLCCLITIMTGLIRLIFRDLIYLFFNKKNKRKINVGIYGAGAAGAKLYALLRLDRKYDVVVFFDDNPKLLRRYINGIPIVSPKNILRYQNKIDHVLLAIPSLNRKTRKRILENLQSYGFKSFQTPSINDLTEGRANINELRPITIEDLLGRDALEIDFKSITNHITNKVVCITGAGGSIGAELSIQIIKQKPKLLIILDKSEFNLYEINNQLNDFMDSSIPILPILNDACNELFLTKLFNDNKVDVVFHAAAYKHVPLVEINPLQGLANNIFSTLSICLSAKNSSVSSLTLISTDKAVRPTNIMGVSKRISELIVQAFANQLEEENKENNLNIRFSMVRFGNVLNSSGSVVPLFKKQINDGGPITLTDEKVTRYFMTIKEAVQLVTLSSAIAKGGEVFLLDMGEPVLIKDLASKMIKLSGFTEKCDTNPEGDIEIITTGLRPGEKLYEELLIDAKSEITSNKFIYLAKEKFIDGYILFPKLDLLKKSILEIDEEKAFKIIHSLVPEWRISLENEI